MVGLTTGSLALAGFALNALLDSSASVVLVWRFRKERSDPVAAEHLERRAQTWVIVAMLLVALYVGVEAVRALINGSHPESSAFGFAIAAISLAGAPGVGVMKLRVAQRLESPALRGDGVLSLAAAALAASPCRTPRQLVSRLVVGRSRTASLIVIALAPGKQHAWPSAIASDSDMPRRSRHRRWAGNGD